jgi:arsenate reductase-like glutaredoxin family protein
MRKKGANMRVFALKSCDTCRKALVQLRAAGFDPRVIDIRADGISEVDLAVILTRFGDDAINRASTTWRGLTDAEKLLDRSQLLRKFPALLKRPVIEHQGQWTQGWGPAVQKALL